MAMLKGSRTRNASAPFVFAFALVLISEEAPTVSITMIDATRNAETFLNILSPHNWRKAVASGCFSMIVWVGIRMLSRALGLAKERRHHCRRFAGILPAFLPAYRKRFCNYLCSRHAPLASHGGGTPNRV